MAITFVVCDKIPQKDYLLEMLTRLPLVKGEKILSNINLGCQVPLKIVNSPSKNSTH